ncbi:MAG: envelope stress response membrane protein PspB [Gammaproteobacteria bacterium]|nr:envelope stress response membrane protein PspB [Gammaproteobacteria bacterium]
MDVIAILALTVVAPIWIAFHYITRWKTTKGLSNDDAQLLEELWEKASTMESRVNALETILDAEVPDWRKKS